MNTFKIIEVEQRSEQWFQARLGRLTGSRAAAMLSTRKDRKEAADRRNLRTQLALERITGIPQEQTFETQAMRDGVTRENDARGLYEAITGQLVHTSGFLQHQTIMAGCSLDGHVGEFDGIVEVKSPLAATHLFYLQTGTVPEEYQQQITHQLWISDARWCDFVSYCPFFPEPLQLKMVRITRDDAAIKAYELAARLFLDEVDAEVEAVDKLALAVA